MLTGSRPGGNIGFGMVTPRIVDLLYRTRIWAQVIAFILFWVPWPSSLLPESCGPRQVASPRLSWFRVWPGSWR